MELTPRCVLHRREDWLARLTALANERRSQPYLYGKNDCWCFAQAAIAEVTGVTVLAQFDNPKGWLAAARIMIAQGWDSVEDVMTAAVGTSIEDPGRSRPGDIVSYQEAGELHLAVRVGDVALTPVTDGLKVVGPEQWNRAWAVG